LAEDIIKGQSNSRERLPRSEKKKKKGRNTASQAARKKQPIKIAVCRDSAFTQEGLLRGDDTQET
jgi:hypothetical protein